MTKRMLVDATHPEETRVAIVDSYRDINRLDDLDFDLASKPLLKGNIYLAKVMRVEPSLQAAFVEYGGNRHGFLSFSEIHPDYFRIPVADRPAGEEDDQSDLIPTDFAPIDPISPEDIVPDGREEADDAPAYEPHDHEESSAYDPQEEEPLPFHTAPMSPLPLAIDLSGNIEPDNDVGLITDFGNPSAPVEGAVEAVQPIESVGGEATERFVRRPQRPRYKIQEVVKRGQVMLVQVVKEERGNKGAALTTFLSLAGRYCVLMPNTDHGGGVSRKITNHQDRRRLKDVLDQLELPEGMAVILRTAGMEQAPQEIQRDLEYLLRLWNNIREQTLQSTAPSLIYEEANLIKRSVRDLYSQDIAEILVAGEEGYRRAREFMQTIMPDDVEKIKLYQEPIPLFFRYHVENQIDSFHTPIAQLRSGGYLVINPTEALVSIDVNSGRATRERHIEETALKTNLEAADEIARQLRLRDLAGLVVIDFIDMEDPRNNAAVERRMKEAMKNDRARLQIGRITPFGLMELSRQRLRPSLLEINFEKCPHCAGSGYLRSVDSAALSLLRVIEEEGIKQRSAELILHVPTKVALYLLNQKRAALMGIEKTYDLSVLLKSDDALIPSDYKIERLRNRQGHKITAPAVDTDQVLADTEKHMPMSAAEPDDESEPNDAPQSGQREGRQRQRQGREQEQGLEQGQGNSRRRVRDRGDRGDRRNRNNKPPHRDQASPETINAQVPTNAVEIPEGTAPQQEGGVQALQDGQRRRRRGRRGGRRRGAEGENKNPNYNNDAPESAPAVGHTVSNNVVVPSIPMDVRDIDTTPRERPIERTPRSSSVEVVNPPVDGPKGGWWRRLTGQ